METKKILLVLLFFIVIGSVAADLCMPPTYISGQINYQNGSRVLHSVNVTLYVNGSLSESILTRSGSYFFGNLSIPTQGSSAFLITVENAVTGTRTGSISCGEMKGSFDITVDKKQGENSEKNQTEITPGNITPGTTPGNVTPGTTPGNVTPGTTPGNITPGTTPGNLTPGTTPGNLTPGTTPGNLTPGTTPENLTPGTTPENITPGTTPENITPGTTPENTTPGTTPENTTPGTTPGGEKPTNEPKSQGDSFGYILLILVIAAIAIIIYVIYIYYIKYK